MVHKNRVFGQPAEPASAEDLAEKLTRNTWVLCSAWKLGDLLFLNDSFSEDGAAEYAVVKNGRQIESITFGWCDKEEAVDAIKRLVTGELGADYGAVDLRFHPQGESCSRCA